MLEEVATNVTIAKPKRPIVDGVATTIEFFVT